MKSKYPNISFLKEQFFLVQAWKKTVSYIRYHNSYSDTLELDLASVDLPNFIKQLSDKIDTWVNDPIKIVPSPKSQKWYVDKNDNWKPKKKYVYNLRPLAHVSIKDQVLATAVMLCLADKVEQMQGSTLVSLSDLSDRKNTISYGNRLYCSPDTKTGKLLHHWGSTKLYRSYFQDYSNFIKRPNTVIDQYTGDKTKLYVVQSDLSKFYDRVSPTLLHTKVIEILGENPDLDFVSLVKKLFSWEWDKAKYNMHSVKEYKKFAKLDNFERIALPQGLVASGFFSNVVLKDFDEFLKGSFNSIVLNKYTILDICRYVDDIKIVLSVEGEIRTKDIEDDVVSWLNKGLNENAQGLIVSKEKTIAVKAFEDKHPIVHQGKRMQQIQTGISGGFDANGGLEILASIKGLLRTQSRFSEDRLDNNSFTFAPVPDVRDDTVARFSANRYRSTYRSLRLLLFDKVVQCKFCKDEINDQDSSIWYTRQELDEEAEIFALGLIENWIEDPSNVRLLRVGLDIYPDKDILETVLTLLKQYIKEDGRSTSRRRVAWYCLSEIFKAGATETGFLENSEELPKSLNIDDYRKCLKEEGLRILRLQKRNVPWYLRQQVLIFLTTIKNLKLSELNLKATNETKEHIKLVNFLHGNYIPKSDENFAMYSVLLRRSYLNEIEAKALITPLLTTGKLENILSRDPSFAYEIIRNHNLNITLDKKYDYFRNEKSEKIDDFENLMCLVLNNDDFLNQINEMSIIKFSILFLNEYKNNISDKDRKSAISPYNIFVRYNNSNIEFFEKLRIESSSVKIENSLYMPPNWCDYNEYWRFNLVYLLRFMLTRNYDYTKNVKKLNWRENQPIYRVPESHWYQRDHGLYSGYSAFGHDWLPISDWTEKFLFALLQWPGCRENAFDDWINKGIVEALAQIKSRLKYLKGKYGHQSSLLMMPVSAPIFNRLGNGTRPLRVCVVQKVIPNGYCFKNNDLKFDKPIIRCCHRNHLASSLAAVRKLLDLRETHRSRNSRLDLLIFPELSIHPEDVSQQLIPFIRTYKTIILAGMNYTKIEGKKHLVNSALWLIPLRTPEGGLQVMIRRQGKYKLAPKEISNFNEIIGFRPCQWIINYIWRNEDEPLKLTSSICYDATDIRLAADLRDQSDVYIIPSFNQDVKTYDQMALALHYHMYQMVIVANNGTYGGSNAFAPYKEDFKREIFHLHGQPQAAIAFLELDDIEDFLNRWNCSSPDNADNDKESKSSGVNWKTPPANTDRPS